MSLEAATGQERQRVQGPADLELAPKLTFLLEPARYKVAYGGRGGGKSWGFARAILWGAFQRRLRILCTREYQASIQESVHQLLSDQIELLGLCDFFRITDRAISGENGSELIFAGIRTDPRKVKSMEGIDICWVEEAEKVSQSSWQILIPTIRKQGSEIWVTFNPDQQSDPTYKRFVVSPPPEAVIRRINWQDNPWFPEELRKEKDYLASVDLEAYHHVYEGKCCTHSAAQILAGKCVVRWFEPDPVWDGPYFGSDLGFAQDPTTLGKSWIGPGELGGKKLYIEREAYQIGLELEQMPGFMEWAGQHVIRMDNSRPETISYLRRRGLNVAPSIKGKRSVKEGIELLRSFEQIVIHPDCRHHLEESRLYSYKTDRISGDVLPEVLDRHNHCWDGQRYALEPIMRGGGLGQRWNLN